MINYKVNFWLGNGRHGLLQFFAGLLLGPIALLAVVGLPDKKPRQYVPGLALKLDAIEVGLPHREIAAAKAPGLVTQLAGS